MKSTTVQGLTTYLNLIYLFGKTTLVVTKLLVNLFFGYPTIQFCPFYHQLANIKLEIPKNPR